MRVREERVRDGRELVLGLHQVHVVGRFGHLIFQMEYRQPHVNAHYRSEMDSVKCIVFANILKIKQLLILEKKHRYCFDATAFSNIVFVS